MIPSARPNSRAGLARLGPPFLGLVTVEFLLGISLNLFVTLPSGSPATILASSPLLDVHLLVGLLLLGIATNAFRLSRRESGRAPAVVTGLGLLSGLGAFGAGLSFAFGSPSAVASFAMSAGFVGLMLEAAYLLSLRRAVVSPIGGGATATEGAGG